MTIADMVRRMADAGATGELIAIAVEALAEALEEACKQVAGTKHQELRDWLSDRPPDVSPEDWSRLRLDILGRDGPNCAYCGAVVELNFCCNHVVPRSRGGASVISNLAVTCKRCCSSKKDLLVTEWEERRCH